MSTQLGRRPKPQADAPDTQTLEQLFEIVALELMAVLDHVEEAHGLEIESDPRLRGADKLLGLYILWKQGDISLPWIAENLAESLAKNHRGESSGCLKKKQRGNGH